MTHSEQWASMDSAPVDDKYRALVFDSFYGVLVAERNGEGGGWCPIETGCGCCSQDVEPIYWMPIPAAPEANTNG